MTKKLVPAPLFRDPIYDGASDPVVIWNKEENCWWMLYTQRRSTEISIGVSSIHGTKIGIASSIDGYKWAYRGTLPDLDFEPGHNTFWAPEVVYFQGKYHMYVSYITGIHSDWDAPRHIVHYTADNLWSWRFEGIVELSSDRVIDACVYEVKPGLFKMWYKDEKHESYSYSAFSEDLYQWTVVGPEITDCHHEGPNVFEFEEKIWMIIDCWDGMGVYISKDFNTWERVGENILQKPGKRPNDGAIGNHGDVVTINGNAYLFYFVHPYNTKEERERSGGECNYKLACTNIQIARLFVEDGVLKCDRDEEFELDLSQC